jgi:hypothetical protein
VTYVIRVVVIGAVSMVALFAIWGTPPPADASNGAWSAPTELSHLQRGAWFPKIAADDNGNVHVIYSGNHDTQQLLDIAALWYTRSSDGQTWTQPRDIALIYTGAALRNSMAADATGRLFVSYKGWGSLEAPPDFTLPTNTGPEDLWFMSSSGSEGDTIHAWPAVRQRISRSSLAYYSDVAIDSRGVIHLIWTESDSLGWGVYYANSADGGASWSPRIALDDQNSVWWYRCHLVVDANDRLHVTYEVTDRVNLGHTRAAFYAQSADGGRTWTKRLMGGEVPRDGSTNEVFGPQAPTVGIDGSSQIIFVYRDLDTSQILYRLSEGGSGWSSPQRLPGVRGGIYRPYDIYDMVTDSAGHVHLAFVGYPDGSPTLSLMHAEWDGHGWSAPDVVVSAPPYPEYPKLAVGGGNRLHLVWFTGDRESIDRTALHVYYSSTRISAPRVISSALPVPQPSVAPPPTVISRPLPQVPSAAANLRTSDRSTEQRTPVDREVDSLPPSSLPVLVAALGAVVLIVVGVFIGLGGLSAARRDR